MKFLFKMVTRVIFVGGWVGSGLRDHARYLCGGASEGRASEGRASERGGERASERGGERARGRARERASERDGQAKS